MEKKIKIILADDHSMVRDALAQVLEETEQFEVLARVGDQPSLEEAIEIKGVEILLIDYSMPGVDCLGITKKLQDEKSPISSLFFSFNKNANDAVKALNHGAQGYVVKSDDIEELIIALKRIYNGKTYVSSSISSEVIHKLTSNSEDKSGLEQLSPREQEFISNLSQGHSLSNIALLMGISTSTASTYRSRILEKLELKTTVDLIKFALDHDLK